MNLSQEIEKCQLCQQHSKDGKIDFTEKPYVTFQVEERWVPKKVEVLFLAGSPPWSKDRYFYKTAMKGNKTHLQKEVLCYLELASLSEFKEKGYLVIDAIKCRLNKQVTEHVPQEVLSCCTRRFLQKEIDRFNPGTIFVLGNSAKHALEQLPCFEELKNHKISEDFDRVVAGRRVIFCVYPGGKTRMHVNSIKRSFGKLKEGSL
ncbi:MAG: uracil-DNA glycosylase family protein [Candidatus Bathyarchaeia archaeon]